MNHKAGIFLMGLLSFLMVCCSQDSEKRAKEILEKSIEAHGGQQAWDNLESLKFRKRTKLLLEDGSVESETDQWIQFRMKPYFEGSLSWTSDSVEHISTFDGTEMKYTMGGNSVQNPDFLKSKKKDFDAAYYVIAQPWKLLQDENVTLTYEGQKKLDTGKLAESVRVNYGPEDDVWWFYFDPLSFEMIGNEVQLKDHRSYIVNNSMVSDGPFLFYGIRTSYRIDENGNKLYVRAAYEYSDFEINIQND
ncbi:DUF6503 family protein [Algoriphagus sp.]|uniref:DUF6503 family protein n=1 Tax=Algoriphagus sp. TaxID=1872435 RepID=UPI0025EA126B|nr:DUF6503 family protein [Algoriphagus sp.]